MSTEPATLAPSPLERITTAVRDMTLASERLIQLAGGRDEIDRMLGAIEDVWLEHDGLRIHLDRHPSTVTPARAAIVFQPGSGAHARVYFLLGALLARRGYEVLAIDRPGHGLSDGPRGDCTIEEAIAVGARVLEHARRTTQRPVVLMGSSMGGLLTIFSLLDGVRPDLAVAHNFVFPGKLVSMRLRARWIRRRRRRPYPLTELVHGFERLSPDPAIEAYLRAREDPGFAWSLSARSVASLFAFARPRSAAAGAPLTLIVTGDRDRAIPAWASRVFARWAGLPRYEVATVRRAGHLLFHDHLDVSVPLVADWLDARLASLPPPSGAC